MSSALDEFDILLNEVEKVSLEKNPTPSPPSYSNGPSVGRGYSSGPGAMSAGPGVAGRGYSNGPGAMSAGPGAAGRGYSAGPGAMSAGPGAAGRGYSAGPGAISAGPGAMSAGPGAMSAGPGAMSAGPGSMSAGPGAAGRGYSSGPGAMSAGPGAAGRGYSNGPGAMSVGPGAMSAGPGAAAGRGYSTGNSQIDPHSLYQNGAMSHGPGIARGAPNSEVKGFENHLPAEYTPDGRKIIYEGPPCAYCGQMIFGKILNALDQTWHHEHFFCNHCSQPFKDGQFLAHEGKPYCVNDFNNLFAPKCQRCTLPITSKKIVFQGKNYHPEHFQCTGCGTSLVGKTPKEEDGFPFCSRCKEARVKRVEAPAHMCAKCKLPIIGEYITLKGQKLHPEHYRCQACGCEFNAGNCHEYEGNLYCYEDYVKLIKDVCWACKKPIPGRSLTAMGRVWHPEHFVCAYCHSPFPGMVFREHDGKPYCEQHYQMLQCPPCAKCGLAVVGGGKSAFGHTWHKEHFVCTGCEKSLIGKTLRAWEQKLYCTTCYNDLPSDLRKEIEKKYQQEQKMKKIREKEAASEQRKIEKEEKKSKKK